MYIDAENARMIEWLRSKPPIVLHAAALSLNWDFAEPTIEWIAQAKDTDEATASALFLLSTPTNFFPWRHKPKNAEEKVYWPSDLASGKSIVDSIAKRWIAGTYLKGHVEVDHQKGFKYSEWGHHPEVYFYLRSQKEFGPLGQMPWPELIGIEGPFHGETPKGLLDYFKGDEDEMFRIFAMQEDLGVGHSETDVVLRPRYLEWRIDNGFGTKPSWKSD